MRAIPLMRFGVFEPFLRYAGAADERLLVEAEKVGLPLQQLRDPDMLVASERVLHLAEIFARRLGASDLGWSVGQFAALDDLGTFGRRIQRAPNLRVALTATANEFHRLHSGARLEVEVTEGAIWLRHLLPGQDQARVDHALQYTLPLLLKLVRRYAGEDWRPLQTRLPASVVGHVPSAAAERERLLPSDRNEASVAIDPAILTRPLGLGPRVGVADLSWEGKPRLADDFVGSVEYVILSMFGSGRITASRVAETGQMSLRSFHRGLAAHDVSFGEVLDRLKFQQAHALLTTSPMKLGEIADFLGYAEQANFNHAFRRWTGSSPGRYRATADAASPP